MSGLAEQMRTPRFGATVTNHIASEANPRRVGYFVRAGRATGRMNPGRWWEITDGRGDFWQLSPDRPRILHTAPNISVDRSTEMPAPGGAS